MQQMPQDGYPTVLAGPCYDTNYNSNCFSGDVDPNVMFTTADFLDAASAAQDDTVMPAGTEAPRAPDPAPTPSAPMQQVFINGRSIPADPAIERLNLSFDTREVAYNLKALVPTVQFTSGLRDVPSQIKAMAENVVKDRRFIAKTYTSTPLSRALQAWIDAHPEAITAGQIEAGMTSVTNTFPLADVQALSKHTAGQAFDVKPVNGSTGDSITNFLRTQPGRFLNREGSLRRWHYQR